MARLDRQHTDLALVRFGLGPQPGERARVGGDPRGWLRAQQTARDPAAAELEALPSGVQLWADALAQRARDTDPQHKATQSYIRRIVQREAAARCALGVRTALPFRERWTRFWCRHFAVSAKKSRIEPIAGAFEREAVRPHVHGRFADMLQAAVTHPAMLVYLDQDRSIGPHSTAGRRKGRGLNENLAREVLELHTLGVDGGYGQADVEALAAVLTGWTAVPPSPARVARLGGALPATATRFAPQRHEPGPKTVLGTVQPAAGADELAAVLDRLAAHPSTARHLAHKLAVHFVADQPPPAVVDALAQAWRDSGGELGAVQQALVDSDAAWAAMAAPAARKLRTPQELIIATGRALALGERPRSGVPLTGDGAGQDWAHRLASQARPLGQPDLLPPSPAGWPDTAEAWAGPDQLLRRVELAAWAGRFGHRGVPDPAAWAADILGSAHSPALAQALADAPDRATAVGLVLASPAFQWR